MFAFKPIEMFLGTGSRLKERNERRVLKTSIASIALFPPTPFLRSCVFSQNEPNSLWGEPRSGPSPAHYLLLAAYAGQQELEQVFRGLKEGDSLNWQPM
jgi:hypothetical protein